MHKLISMQVYIVISNTLIVDKLYDSMILWTDYVKLIRVINIYCKKITLSTTKKKLKKKKELSKVFIVKRRRNRRTNMLFKKTEVIVILIN